MGLLFTRTSYGRRTMKEAKLEHLLMYRRYLERKEFDKVPEDILRKLGRRVLLTTECNPAGITIEERLGIMVVPTVVGMFIVRDWLARLRDIWGGRSRSSQNVITEAAAHAMQQLQVNAFKRGANAVIAVDITYNEVSGKGKSMHQVVVSGTAVRCRDAT